MSIFSRSCACMYIYIYIYIYANFIKHNRHFMPTYSLLDPFEFPYYFYCIRGELIMVLSIVVCIPSTFCPTLGHHQGRICYKSDVTFVLANYYCVSRAESTRDTYNYGQYLNQFPPNTIKVIREFERIQKRICRHKMSIMFNEICINEEMLPKYTYIYIYVCVCVCARTCVCVHEWEKKSYFYVFMRAGLNLIIMHIFSDNIYIYIYILISQRMCKSEKPSTSFINFRSM